MRSKASWCEQLPTGKFGRRSKVEPRFGHATSCTWIPKSCVAKMSHLHVSHCYARAFSNCHIARLTALAKTRHLFGMKLLTRSPKTFFLVLRELNVFRRQRCSAIYYRGGANPPYAQMSS